MSMPTVPRAPHHRRPTTAQSIAVAVITGLMLLFLLAQCDSGASTGAAAPTPSQPLIPSRPTTPAAPVTASASAETSEATPAPEPADDKTTVVDVVAPPPTMPTPAPQPAPTKDDSDDTDSSGGSVYYKNCSAARAAGAAPLHAGDPGYASHLDRDGDGVACES